MAYPPKVNAAIAQLVEAGIPQRAATPMLHRLLWNMGLVVPPPQLAPFSVNFLLLSAFFAIAWGLVMWFGVWSSRGMSPIYALKTSVFAGLAYGLIMALVFRFSAKKFDLPAWSEIKAEGETQ